MQDMSFKEWLLSVLELETDKSEQDRIKEWIKEIEENEKKNEEQKKGDEEDE